MIPIGHSAEIMAAYAEIDLAYYMLEDIIKNPHPNAPKNGIEAMIDKTSGYGKVRNLETIDSTIMWLESIVENKKIIEASFDGDLKALEEAKELRKNFK